MHRTCVSRLCIIYLLYVYKHVAITVFYVGTTNNFFRVADVSVYLSVYLVDRLYFIFLSCC